MGYGYKRDETIFPLESNERGKMNRIGMSWECTKVIGSIPLVRE